MKDLVLTFRIGEMIKQSSHSRRDIRFGKTDRSKSEGPYSFKKTSQWTKPNEKEPTLKTISSNTESPSYGKDEARKTIASEPTTTAPMPSVTNAAPYSQKDTSELGQQLIDLTDEPHGTKNTMVTSQPPGKTVTKDSIKAFITGSTPPTMMETFDPELKDQAAGITAANPSSSTLTTPTDATMSITTHTASSVNPTAALFTYPAKPEDKKTTVTPSTQPLTPQQTSVPLTTPGTTTSPAATTTITPLLTSASAATSAPVEPKDKIKWEQKDGVGLKLDKPTKRHEQPPTKKPSKCPNVSFSICSKRWTFIFHVASYTSAELPVTRFVLQVTVRTHWLPFQSQSLTTPTAGERARG